jgi:hypothetical protein
MVRGGCSQYSSEPCQRWTTRELTGIRSGAPTGAPLRVRAHSNNSSSSYIEKSIDRLIVPYNPIIIFRRDATHLAHVRGGKRAHGRTGKHTVGTNRDTALKLIEKFLYIIQ